MTLALLTRERLAEHLALPVQTSAAYTVFRDEHGHTYAIFPSGFDLMEFTVKFPGFFDGLPVESFNTHGDTVYLGQIH